MKRFLVAIAALCACAIACDDGPQSHVYVAMLYESANACLDPSTTLAIIGTPDGSLNCAPTCLVETAPPAVGAEKVYVSTMCGPYPAAITDLSGTDPECLPALQAFAAGTVCGATTSGDAAAVDAPSGDDTGAPGDSGPASVNDGGDAGDADDSGDEHDSNAE